MPNTLIHIAVQASIGRALLRRGDFIWCLIGLIIPDLAWIFWRIALMLTNNWAPYSLKLYAIVQSSLFGSLLLCAAIAALAQKPNRVFIILATNALLHLLLDATQIKWANGVLLGAPFTWQLTQFSFFWPENWIGDLLTVLGFLGCLSFTWQSRSFSIQGLFKLSKLKILSAGLFLLLYWTAPPLLWSGAIKADNHFIQTLSQVEARPGKVIELDRVYFRKESDRLWIHTLWGGDLFAATPVLSKAGTISIRGIFIDTHRIQITDYHLHRSGWRDGASILGLIWVTFFIFWKTRWRS